MAIIYSYPPNNNILSTDILVCTSTALVGGKPKNQTKSLSIGSLATFIITSPSNNLNQILTNGNTSELDAKIGELYLYDSPNSSYAKISIQDSYLSINRAEGGGTPMLSSDNGYSFTMNNGTANAAIINPLTVSRTYTLPDKSGTIALTSDIPSLQQVVNVGNTIVVPTTVAKGIDITLANQTSVFQNGISVTIPTQTGAFPTYNPAPDAFVANINGQTPGTLIGSVVGFLANATNDDNIGFFADLTATSGTSRGFEVSSFDAHTGDYFVARKYIVGVDSVVFKVANNGDTTAKSFIKTGGTSDQFLKANGSTSTMPTLQEVTTAGSTTTASVIAVTSGKVLIGTTEAGQPMTGSDPQLVVTLPYTGISKGGVIDLRNLSPFIAPNDLLGRIQFTGKDDLSTGYTSSAIEGIAANFAGSGNPGGGILLFKTSANSTGAMPIEKMRITQNGVVQPGTDNSYSLGASGIRWSAVWAANGTIQTSDEREKKDIVDSDLGLDFISKLRPVSFKWKVGKNEVTSELDGLDEEGNPKTKIVVTPIEGKRTHYGLIAQEVEVALNGKDFGGFIHDKETDIKGLRYDQLIPIMINAIKELKAEIEILKAK